MDNYQVDAARALRLLAAEVVHIAEAEVIVDSLAVGTDKAVGVE